MSTHYIHSTRELFSAGELPQKDKLTLADRMISVIVERTLTYMDGLYNPPYS